MIRIIIIFISTFFFFYSLLSLAYAHQIEHLRELYLYIGTDKVYLRIIYHIPAGDRAFKIRKKFDTNGDGFIDDSESEALKRYVAQDAVKGLKISFQERPVNIYTYNVVLDFARESSSSLEISASLNVPIWLAQAPPPPYFKIGLVEERFGHTHISIESVFKLKFSGYKFKEGDGIFYGELIRTKPLAVKVLRE